jgi:hypothetical protein
MQEKSWAKMPSTLPLGMINVMGKRIPPEVLEYFKGLGKYGKLGGKAAAKNMTAAERSARAKIASLAAAKKRTADRLERERQAKVPRRFPKRK